MFNPDFTFLWTAVNLAVLYFFIKKFLFWRLAKKMDERAAFIAEGLSKGEELKKESEAFNRQREDWQRESAAKQKIIMDESKTAADRETQRILREAIQEASRIKEDAKNNIERERLTMRKQLSDETVRLALAAASGVLGANMDLERNRELAEKFIADEEAS